MGSIGQYHDSHQRSTATYQLSIQDIFEGLSRQEQLYAHHLSQAAWHGARIILRQTSPEGNDIFDFIIELHKACQGQWNRFIDDFNVKEEELNNFLDYAGMFMSKMNNFCGEGDRKIVPDVSAGALRKLASISEAATTILKKVLEPMLSTTPATLTLKHSTYYPGSTKITLEEISAIARVMEEFGLEPENTRLRKDMDGNQIVYEILQASSQTNAELKERLKGFAQPIDVLHNPKSNQTQSATIRLLRGDHLAEMTKVCEHLLKAVRFSANEIQTQFIMDYIDSFRTGSLEAYRRSMENWVQDCYPRVESILGFVEPYRDPYGARCEWRGVISISDPQETAKLTALVKNATKFIQTLPWAKDGCNDGKGPFEKNHFKAPDFSVVHALTFVCSNIWEASNVPNYNDIREMHGFKNIVYINRMSANADPSRPIHCVHPSEVQRFRDLYPITRFIVTSIHELLGHGTGKLLAETSPGVFNFDYEDKPINSLTGGPIQSWYKPEQTWTSVFKKLACTVEECRAMLISYYLGEGKDMLCRYGYNDITDITADDLIYNMYLYIGVEGLRALQAYNVDEQTWGSPHANANYAIFKYLLEDVKGLFVVSCDQSARELYVQVCRTKIYSEGKASIGRMLHKIHLWRCTADVDACKALYEPLSTVQGEHEIWRQIVISWPDPAWKFVQANTFLKDNGQVGMKVYEASNQGIIESFADRNL